jgi:hypothetical protein
VEGLGRREAALGCAHLSSVVKSASRPRSVITNRILCGSRLMYCNSVKRATSSLEINFKRMIRPCSPAAFNSFNSAICLLVSASVIGCLVRVSAAPIFARRDSQRTENAQGRCAFTPALRCSTIERMKGATARPWQPAQFDRLSRSGLSCHRIVAAIYCAFSNNPGCFATLAAIRRASSLVSGLAADLRPAVALLSPKNVQSRQLFFCRAPRPGFSRGPPTRFVGLARVGGRF